MSQADLALTPNVSDTNQWPEIFYGMLVAPDKTMTVLSEDPEIATSRKTVWGALVIVLLSHAISGSTESGGTGVIPSLAIVLGALFQGAVGWLALSSILYILCGWLSKRELAFNTTLICVGWAFLPLIFAGPVSCFHVFKPIYPLLSAIPIVWMFYLQWLAFEHCLSMSGVKMFALLILGPPIFLLTYLFWLSFAFVGLVQAFL